MKEIDRSIKQYTNQKKTKIAYLRFDSAIWWRLWAAITKYENQAIEEIQINKLRAIIYWLTPLFIDQKNLKFEGKNQHNLKTSDRSITELIFMTAFIKRCGKKSTKDQSLFGYFVAIQYPCPCLGCLRWSLMIAYDHDDATHADDQSVYQS